VDKLTIETPEQVHLEFILAGIGSRFMATLLDMVIQALLYLVLFVVLIIFSANPFTRKFPMWVEAVFILISFCIYWGYYAIFEIVWKGQTPGKRLAGIRVIKDSGRAISPFEAIARNLLRAVDWLPSLYAIGVVTMLLNPKSRRLGDFVAGTLVVHETSDRETDLFFNTKEQTEFVFPQAAKLTLAEAELIETFLARRLDIPPDIRRQNSQRIAELLIARLGTPGDARPADNEDFLELLVKEFRNRAKYR
jgi:uncharacterized RDD family membrane protein YckC